MLLPEQFDVLTPERICNACVPKLEPEQSRLVASRAKAQLPNELREGEHTGGNRRYLNQPIKFELGAEIRKACWALRNQMDGLQVELGDQDVQESQLRGAIALCLVTTVQGGMILTGSVGTGLVVRKRPDGSWSAPCAIGTMGIGFGASFGIQSTDMIVVVHNEAALKTFMSGGSLSLGAEVGLSVGPFGRNAAAEVRANEKGMASTSSYSQSKGFYGGVQIDGQVLKVRHEVNRDFYGRDVTAHQILMDIDPPLAAQPLYDKIAQLYALFGISDPAVATQPRIAPQASAPRADRPSTPPGGWLGSNQRLDYVDRTDSNGTLQGGSLRGTFDADEFAYSAPTGSGAMSRNSASSEINDVFV